MEKHDLILLEQVCINCKIDDSFIRSLHDLGHIEVIIENDAHYISEEQLKSLESLIYFYTELEINMEGIDAIAHLLKKMADLQNELTVTKNKLTLYLGK